MSKRFVVLFLVLASFSFAALISGCGQGGSVSGGGGGGGQSVTISGMVAASSTDLAQLGVSTLSVKSAGMVNLTSRGFTAKSVRAARLVPMVVGETTFTVGTLNADGTLTAVETTSVSADGTYTVTIPDYDPTKTYGATVVKTSSDTDKTLEYKVIYPAPTDGEIAGSGAAISPQTTLVAQMIIDKVVVELESAAVDPEVIANVKDAIISAVDDLITDGTITVNCVRDASAAENAALTAAADKASSDTTISGKLDSVKGALGLAKATDLDSAKGAIFELFKIMTGDPRGVPEEIVNSFAQAFLDGVTKTTADITTAINHSLYNPVDKSEAVGAFTASEVAGEIQGMLRAVYGSTPAPDMPTGVKTVIEAVFPKSEWATKTISASTTFSVPRILMLVFLGEKLAHESDPPLAFNGPKVAYELGLMAGTENKLSIMHAELRIISFENWLDFIPTGPDSKPPVERAIASWVDVGNIINPDPAQTVGITCWLQYPKAGGGTATAQYTDMSSMGPKSASVKSVRAMQEGTIGPPPGWKNFSINPWGMGPESPGTVIKDFAGGIATIIIKNSSGVEIARKDVTLYDIDLSAVDLTINIPKMAWIDHPENMSSFPKNTQPAFNWKLNSLGGATIPEGHRLGYAINVVRGEFQTDPSGNPMFFANWGDESAKIFDSWNKQNFPTVTVGENTSWVVPSAISADAVCEFGITVVVINKETKQPIAESPHRGSLFIVGSPDIPDVFGPPPPPPPSVLTGGLTLEGKVHANVLSRYVGANLKVALFREGYDPSLGFKITQVEGVTPVGLNEVAGQTYKSFSLPFNGEAFGENYGQYIVVLWNDANSDGLLDFGTEMQERAQKMIDHQPFGTMAHWPDDMGGAPLSDSQGNFNFIMWGDSF